MRVGSRCGGRSGVGLYMGGFSGAIWRRFGVDLRSFRVDLRRLRGLYTRSMWERVWGDPWSTPGGFRSVDMGIDGGRPCLWGPSAPAARHVTRGVARPHVARVHVWRPLRARAAAAPPKASAACGSVGGRALRFSGRPTADQDQARRPDGQGTQTRARAHRLRARLSLCVRLSLCCECLGELVKLGGQNTLTDLGAELTRAGSSRGPLVLQQSLRPPSGTSPLCCET